MSEPQRSRVHPVHCPITLPQRSKPFALAWCAASIVVGLASLLATAAQAQVVHQVRGVDSLVDYASLVEIGPWDDRNYRLTRQDLDLLAPNEKALKAQIPAFFRVEMRRAIPEMRRTGPVQYPRSALQVFILKYGGYLVEGKIYPGAELEDGRYRVLTEEGGVAEEAFWQQKFLDGEVRITSPNGAAESAIKVNPVDTNRVIAGSNGPGSGQIMHFSTDGGDSWSTSTALPGGGTCCDPTVDWSSDGSLAYTATLGNCGGSGCQIWFYRSSDGGQTWNDLPGATPRRTLSTGNANDKEYLHVDKYATSPFKDNLYVTWHSNNILQFARSTNSGESWSAQSFSSASDQLGIGSDITTDKNGHVYYFWPAFNSRRILLRKSTDGGASFGTVSEVSSTEASFAFPVPSMETREVFVYVSADADLSNGPFGGSIYAAWTDSTSATGSTAANNHARIQVAFSRDGGASWTVTTPHETADALSVDRWHQWLAVGPDGKVHVVFYDTRRAANRASVDLFYAFSDDGAQTWSAPTRITAAQSPNIGSSFEFGDYNGLDIVMSDLIAIYTDNRNEGGGGGDSVDVYAAGIPVNGGGNTAPQVTISAPANGSSFTEGTSIAFTGTATDAEDGNLTASLTWSSSLDGNLGNGGNISSALSVGSHTVTAAVTDSGGLQGSAAIDVTVTCQSSSGGLAEDFEGGAGAWTAGGLWHLTVDSSCANPGYASPLNAMYYGQDSGCNYDTGAATSGDLISPSISGVTADSTLTFDYFRQVEGPTNNPFDTTEVAVAVTGSGTWTTVWSKDSREASENAWVTSGAIALAAFAGSDVQLRFRFDSGDEISNGFTGWLIDDVTVTGTCGGCPLAVGHPDFCRDCGPCSAGEGDCEVGQCDAGLVCSQNVGANYGFTPQTDVCEAGCPLAPGHPDYCVTCGPCEAGQGDCEPGQCSAGLVCSQDVGANYGFTPQTDVCEVGCPLAPGHPDYCITCGPCSAGQGDCEPGQCDAGLVCSQDVGANYGFTPQTDVCEPGCPLAPGHPDFCVTCGPCSAGQGDCEVGQCNAGLTCSQNVGANYGFTPQTDVCEVLP
ncbi:MAG: hypothetical protein AAF657_10610 [Acidobacteriota bacterium]